MSLNHTRMNRNKMYDLLSKLALIMEPSDECVDLVCVGGGSLILFDELFQDGMSTDIDAFMLDLSRFSEQFLFDIDETAYQENQRPENNDCLLGVDWLNDEIAREDIYKDIDIYEFLDYLDYSKATTFLNRDGNPGIRLIPASADIVIMAKILSDRFKDIVVVQRFVTLAGLPDLARFHEYFSNAVPSFIHDPRYVRALAYMSKNIYGEEEDELCEFLDEKGISYQFEEIQEYLATAPWGDPVEN